MISPSGVIVGRAIVRTDQLAQGSARDGLARTILEASPDRVLDSPDAVLCVRRLVDPLPQKLRFDLRDLDADGEWRNGLRAMLVSLAREAERPADGPVRPTANAILFRNKAEMLACLAFDWSTPDGRAHWWWRRLVPATPDAVTRAWIDAAVAVPAAIELLRDRGRLAAGLASFARNDSLQVCRAVAERYGLSSISAAISTAPYTAPSAGPSATASAGATVPRPIAKLAGRPADDRPGQRTPILLSRAPSAPAPSLDRLAKSLSIAEPLRPDHQAVAVLALAIQEGWTRDHRPMLARSIAVALYGSEPPVEVATHAQRRAPTVRAMAAAAAPGNEPAREAAARPPRPMHRAPTSKPRRHVAVQLEERATKTGSGAVRERARVAPARRPVPEPAIVQTAIAANARTATSAASVTDGERLETHLGGVFYILNAALALGLYGDFTQPNRPGIRLDPWDFVEIMSRRLGPSGEEDPDSGDPIWPLLGMLAKRRPGQRRGIGFRPAPDWRIDPGWLTPFDQRRGSWRWSALDGRVRVLHPAGFPVIDIACSDADVGALVRIELQPYRRRRRLRRDESAPRPRRRATARWIDSASEYLRARLMLGLGLRDANSLLRTLFRHDAIVVVTSTSVDVSFALGQLPIAIRTSGLDRDPGWIPAARRDIRFHYE